MWPGLREEKKKIWLGFQQKKKEMWPGFRQEKKKRAGAPAKIYGGGFPQLNDDMVGIPTRKGLGFQQIYGVANLISEHERGRKRREIGVT